MTDQPMTTAEALGKLRKELIEADVPTQVADDITINAARELIVTNGIAVKA